MWASRSSSALDLLVIGLGGRGHDAVQAQAQDADQLQQLLVLWRRPSASRSQMASSRAHEAVGQRADGAALVPLQEPEGRGLLVVEAAVVELLEGLLVREAVGQPSMSSTEVRMLSCVGNRSRASRSSIWPTSRPSQLFVMSSLCSSRMLLAFARIEPALRSHPWVPRVSIPFSTG